MSGAKFYIWGGGRWRELNTESAKVAGWSRRAHFLFARHGRLRVATRRRVLAALQAHAANLPSAVGLGPRLSVLRNEPVSAPTESERTLDIAQPAPCGHHHCCVYSHGCAAKNFGICNHNGAVISNYCFASATKVSTVSTGTSLTNGACLTNEVDASSRRWDASTRHRVIADAAIQHDPQDYQSLTINLAAPNYSHPKKLPQTHRYDPDESQQPEAGDTRRIDRSRAPPLDRLLGKHSANSTKRRRSVTSDSDGSKRDFKRPSKTRRNEDSERSHRGRPKETTSMTRWTGIARGKKKPRSESSSSERAEEVCKELTISESDVMALRSYVARTRADALERFDADDGYKRTLFYAINPLVDVERCAHTERALRERHVAALPHFAARLGLAPRASTPDADKENKYTEQTNKRVLRPSGGRRGTALPTDDSVGESDSDNDIELFQYSRGNREPARTRSHAVSRGDDKLSRNYKTDTNRGNLPKTVMKVLNGKELASLQGSYTKRNLGSSNDDQSEKRRINPRLTTNTSGRNSGNFETFEKREILRSTRKNKLESNNKSKDRNNETSRRDALRKPESDTEGSDSAEQFEPPKKSKLENRASSDKRMVLRHKDVIHNKHDTEDSDGDDKLKTLKESVNKPLSHTSKADKRRSVRHRTVTLRRTTTETSDSGDENRTHTKSEGKSVKRDATRRQSLRSKTVVRLQAKSLDSGTEEGGKTSTESESESNRAPSNKRESLRHKSKPDIREADSDHEIETSSKSRENKRRLVRPFTQNYNEQSDIEKDSVTLQKSASPAKNVLNNRSGRTAGRERTEVLNSSKIVKPSTKPGQIKIRHQSPTSAVVNRATEEARPSVNMTTHTISKRASSGKAKEYSNLEDHAIVAWVSGGARARRVNGNALWRELQEQYARLTGVRRSWHSLRNRYLRYILPALGALRLPPADVSRLRAAAATGSLKRKGGAGTARRNSIFEQSAVRAASARGTRPAPAPSPPAPPPPPPPPQTKHDSSSVFSGEEASSSTRRLTRRSAVEGAADLDPAPGGGAPDDEGGGGDAGGGGRRPLRSRLPPSAHSGSRQLYNPKLVL